MTINNVKNSSGKIIGYIEFYDDYFLIYNGKKPILKIEDKNDIFQIKNKNKTDSFLIHLYDDYLLTCGEIASLYGVCYSTINKIIKKLPVKTTRNIGRRNSSYNVIFNKERKKHISNSLQGRKPSYYERTLEIKGKISSSLKKYYQLNPQNPQPHRDNWEKGIYKNVDFHRGIGGKIFSYKNQRQYNFRSLLELYYMLILEEDNNIKNYIFEPFHILCEDKTTYTPDFLINNFQVVELKSKKFLKSLPLENYNRFLFKCEQAKKYCLLNNLSYQVIYDEEINFDSAQMKKHLINHPEIIEKYQIHFNQPERIWSKK